MKKKCLFIGSKQMGLRVLKRVFEISQNHGNNLLACITIDDSKDSRSAFDSFHLFSQCSKLPIEVISSHNQIKEKITKYKPDFCLVVGWYWIFPQAVLDLVPQGMFGIHASLLPKYRGGAPLVWQIINNEKFGGVSLFKFDQGIDTGDVYAQKRFSIKRSDTIAEVLVKAEESAVEIIGKCYPRFSTGGYYGSQQPDKNASYCSLRRSGDGRIDWRCSAEYIYNFIRAQTKPYPGAFSYRADGTKIIFVSVEEFKYDYYGIPGRVNLLSEQGVLISCGTGAIIAKTLEGEDQKLCNANRLLSFGETLT